MFMLMCGRGWTAVAAAGAAAVAAAVAAVVVAVLWATWYLVYRNIKIESYQYTIYRENTPMHGSEGALNLTIMYHRSAAQDVDSAAAMVV